MMTRIDALTTTTSQQGAPLLLPDSSPPRLCLPAGRASLRRHVLLVLCTLRGVPGRCAPPSSSGEPQLVERGGADGS